MVCVEADVPACVVQGALYEVVMQRSGSWARVSTEQDDCELTDE